MNYKDTLMWKEISETPRIFSEIQAANAGVMTELVSAIKAAKATNFVAAARGTSDHALIYFKYLLEITSNYTVGLSAPSVITLYKGKINYSNSIVIGCSQSGKAADVLEVIRKGNEQGAITISVTNDRESPLAKEAKFHLYCNCKEEKSVAATKTFSAQLYLLAWLASELAGNKADLKMLASLGKDIERVIPQIDELTTKFAEKFKDMKSGFVLSRGITYAIALEATLKLQETCYIQMKGYPGSDFYHGPMAMVNPETPVIIYCAKNNGAAGTIDVKRTKLKQFLCYLDGRQVDLPDITASVVSDYMTTLYRYKRSTIHIISSVLRDFFRYLYMTGVLKDDLSGDVPRPKIYVEESFPETWTPEEIWQLLSAINRRTAVGKRDYAMILLAAVLGMRAGDICALKFREIDWHKKVITYAQQKSGKINALPLLSPIGDAIIDYLKNGRLDSDCDNVFIRHVHPYGPIASSSTLSENIKRYMRQAGMTIRKRYGGKHASQGWCSPHDDQ